MNLSVIEAVMWKYPTVVQSSHLENDSIVFDSWECAEHPAIPTQFELATWDAEYKASQDYFIPRFDVNMFQTDLRNALPTLSNFNLRWEFGALNTYAQNRDFQGLLGYILLLQGGGVATQGDVDTIKSLITKQGIIL